MTKHTKKHILIIETTHHYYDEEALHLMKPISNDSSILMIDMYTVLR